MKRAICTTVGIVIGIWVLSAAAVGQNPSDSEKLLPFMNEHMSWGYMTGSGKVMIQPKYDQAGPFSQGMALVWSGDKPVYINGSGREIWSPPDVSNLSYAETGLLATELGKFGEGLVNVKERKLFGFIDGSGRYVIKPQFLGALQFSGGTAAVKTPDGWGFIRKDGTFAIRPRFEEASSFEEGLAAVAENGKYGYLDASGKLVVPLKFDKAGDFSEGLAKVGMVDPGKKDTPGMFGGVFGGDDIYQWGYVDKTGAPVIGHQFSNAGDFSEGLAAVKIKGGAWGYIDKTGKMVIPPRFEEASKFSEGLAAVSVDGQWGYIDKTGKMIIPARFAMVRDFSDGLALVWVEETEETSRIGYILKDGKFFWGPTK
jgi:hypothetical protein